MKIMANKKRGGVGNYKKLLTTYVVYYLNWLGILKRKKKKYK